MKRTFSPASPVAILALTLVAGGCAATGWQGLGGADPRDDLTFEHGMNRAPTPETLYSMARIVAAQGKESVQEFILRRILREHPRFLPAHCDLAELQMRRGELDQAMETLSGGLRVSPQDHVLLNNLGMCWFLKGNYDQALGHFTRAAALFPENARYRGNLAAALGMRGRYEESFHVYEQVLPPWEAHYNLAVLSEAKQDHARAAEAYRRAGSLEPRQGPRGSSASTPVLPPAAPAAPAAPGRGPGGG